MMRARQPGFSLIELLISVLIGTLAMVFVMRTTIGFETDRRGSIGGSDSMQNGVVALFSMESDAAQSGWGLNDDLLLGCAANFFDSQNYLDSQNYNKSPARNSSAAGGIALTLAPVSVVFNGANPDVISFASGTSDAGTGSAGLAFSAAAGSGSLIIDQVPFGFKLRDVLAIAPTAAGGTCAIAQVSEVVFSPPAPSPSLKIANDGTPATRFNSTGGLLAGFLGPNQAKVFNLGDGASLSFHTWDVNNGVLRLRATDLSSASNTPASAVSGIVSIKALYGFDTRAGAAFTPNFGLQINQWSAGMIAADQGGNPLSISQAYQRLAAVRLAVVARSREPEKADAGGTTCPKTNPPVAPDTPTSMTILSMPKVFASQEPAAIATVPILVNVAVAGDPIDWSCYRYRLSETIVPLRNSGWKP